MAFICSNVLPFAATTRSQGLDATDRVEREITRRGITTFAPECNEKRANLEFGAWLAGCTSTVRGKSLVIAAGGLSRNKDGTSGNERDQESTVNQQ